MDLLLVKGQNPESFIRLSEKISYSQLANELIQTEYIQNRTEKKNVNYMCLRSLWSLKGMLGWATTFWAMAARVWETTKKVAPKLPAQWSWSILHMMEEYNGRIFPLWTEESLLMELTSCLHYKLLSRSLLVKGFKKWWVIHVRTRKWETYLHFATKRQFTLIAFPELPFWRCG